MKHLSILLFFLINIGSTQAQESYTISGTVESQKRELLSLGEVYLLTQENMLVEFTILEGGNFKLHPVKKGNYILKINALGYEEFSEIIQIEGDKKIHLQFKKSTTLLDEVLITAEKRTIIQKNGDFKINIENSAFESLPQTKDVLSKLPKIQISPDGESISVVGKGTPLLYLGNQRINVQDLNALPVSSIRSIEIINNPSARYEAEGRSVILITRKHNYQDGWRGSLSEIASFKRRFNNYAGINASLKENNLEFRGNFSYNQLHHWENNSSEFYLPEQDIASRYLVVTSSPRPQFVTGGGVYYQFNENDYVSANVNYRTQKENFPLKTNTFLKQQENVQDILTLSKNKEKRNFLTSNINFNRSWNDNSNLFFGLQYSNYSQHLKSSISNNINASGFEPAQNRDQSYTIGKYVFRIDYEKTFNDNIKLEIGGNSSIAKANAFSDINYENDDATISRYDYSEDIFSLYSQLSGKLSIISYSIGLRSETAIVKGGFKNKSDLLIDRKETNLFPKAELSIPLGENKNITFNYSQSISRPNYSNTSSITGYINPFLQFSGDINLKPTLTEEYSASFQYRKSSLSLNYYTQKNPIYYTVAYNNQEDILTMSPSNLEFERGFQLAITSPINYKFWTSSNTLMFAYNEVKDSNAVVMEAKPYLYYYSNNEFDVLPKTTISLNFWGVTERYQGIYQRNALFVAGASISRTFFEDLQVALNFNDIFKAMNYKESYSINGIRSKSIFYVDGQEIAISLKYSFGKNSKTSFQNKAVDDELDRLK